MAVQPAVIVGAKQQGGVKNYCCVAVKMSTAQFSTGLLTYRNRIEAFEQFFALGGLRAVELPCFGAERGRVGYAYTLRVTDESQK